MLVNVYMNQHDELWDMIQHDEFFDSVVMIYDNYNDIIVPVVY